MRQLRAHVTGIVALLPLKIWYNPTWALVAMVPFTGLFPAFGRVALWRFGLAIALHGLHSLAAYAIQRGYRRAPAALEDWSRRLTALQAFDGLAWGAMSWLLWVPDDALNHAVVLAPLIAVLTGHASSAKGWDDFLAGVLPMVALTLLRFLTDPAEANLGLAALLATAFVYSFVVAIRAMRQVRWLIRARLANEDLTSDLRAARDEALEKRNEAEAANIAKSAFLANMSHELRTPLNAIIGFSEIIAQEVFGSVGVKRYREYAQDIYGSGRHLLGIIDDILDVAKIDTGKMKMSPALFDVRQAVHDAIDTLMERIEKKRQTLRLRIAADVGAVFADENAFRHVLVNLVDNAMKFTQESGEIEVCVQALADGALEVSVGDNGPGFDPALIESMFRPFNQAAGRYERQEGGTGLGLSLVHGLMALHGGTVRIETALGAGFRATVHFPPPAGVREPAMPVRLSA